MMPKIEKDQTYIPRAQKVVIFLWTTFFALVFLFFSGYGLISLIHFALEDRYGMPITPFFATELFGFEYATFLSLGLILSIVFLVLDFFNRYFLKKNPLIFSDQIRIAFFYVFLAVIVYVFCRDLIFILYGFFSGHTGAFGLQTTSATLIFSSLTFVYIYVQLKKFSFLLSKAYSATILLFTGAGMALGLYITLIYAPPWTMGEINREMKALILLEESLPDAIKSYWSDYKALPQKLDDLSFWRTVEPEIKPYIHYTLNAPQKCTACIQLKVDPMKTRRLRMGTNLSDSLQGHVCRSFHLTEEKKEGENVVVLHALLVPSTPLAKTPLSASTPPSQTGPQN